MYLAEHGITKGTEANTFSPAQPVTVRQWAVMLCRAYELETSGETWAELGRSATEQACQKGWLNVTALSAPDTRMCRGALYESALAAAGIPVYDSVLYEGETNLSAYDNYLLLHLTVKGTDQRDDCQNQSNVVGCADCTVRRHCRSDWKYPPGEGKRDPGCCNRHGSDAAPLHSGLWIGNDAPRFIFGALYLFSINALFIMLATAFVTKLMGIPSLQDGELKSQKRVKRLISAITVLTVIPSVLIGGFKVYQTVMKQNFANYLANEFSFSDVQVVKSDMDLFNRKASVSLIGTQIPGEVIERLEQELPQYDLNGYTISVTQNNYSQGDSSEMVTIAVQEIMCYEISRKELIFRLNSSINKKYCIVQSVFIKKGL